MRQKILLAGLFLGGVLGNSISAQKYLGLSHSNYSGVYGTQYNPAKLTDTKVKFALNLLSTNLMTNNNLYKFNTQTDILTLNSVFQYNDVAVHRDFNIMGSLEVLGPSAQFTLGNKLGFGLATRYRVFAHGKGINSHLLEALSSGLTTTERTTDASGFSTNRTILVDAGVKGAYAVIDDEEKKLSLGASVKYYGGFVFNSINARNYDMTYNEATDDLSIHNIDWEYYSNDIYDNNSNFGKGFGGDIGAEFILKKGKKDTPYFLKVGASINDIGRIRYDNVTRTSISGSSNRNVSLSNMQVLGLGKNILNNLGELAASGLNVTYATGTVKQSLPTHLNVYADYPINKRFFVSVNALVNLTKVESHHAYHYQNQAGLVPRFESKWIDVAVPLSYNFMSGDFKPGLALRLGPLSIGSDDVKFLFMRSRGANIYAGLGFILYKKPEMIISDVKKNLDTDNDGIIDQYDFCPNVPGPAENNGCPVDDTDSDGLIDLRDKCPRIPGPKENDGCPWPDTDGDGILDKDDKCPTEPGLAEYFGCPKPASKFAEEATKALQGITFDFGKATLTKASLPKLDQTAEIIKGSKSNFLITGHTDKKGNDAINLKISRERAASVVKALEERGVNPQQLKSRGVGSKDAIVPITASDADREIDRKVVVEAMSGEAWEALQKSDVTEAKKTPVKKPIKMAPKKKK